MSYRMSAFAAALAAAAFAAAPAAAQQRVQVGVLECTSAGGVGFVIGSIREIACTFRGADGSTDGYAGTVRRLGLDLGVAQNIVMVWNVFAPSAGAPRGVLAGNYIGASAEATVGVGLGANALVGGSNNTIALQPVSVSAATGLNVAGGVADLELRARR